MKKLLLPLAGAFALTGCIHTSETIYQEVSRVKVEFESEQAGRIFYEALSKMPAPKTNVQTTHVSIPVVFGHTQTKTTSPNIAFNEAVRRADTNQDGKITEIEAKIFAGQK